MFCFGYEQRGSRSAGLLTTGQLSHPDHAITNAHDAQKFAETVTLFTNGNAALVETLSQKVEEGLLVDNRPLKRVFKESGNENIHVEFENGEVLSFSFLVSKPDLEIDPSLPDQLGVECIPGFGIKVTPPFNKSSVEGVYAAGDCCSPLRMIPNALNMGAFAGCGLARELPRVVPSKSAEVNGSFGMLESVVGEF
jgi:gliotoxin/aspirochlorine biosynthesis thioredoxin reductase